MRVKREISYCGIHKINLQIQKTLKETIYTSPEGEGIIRDKLTNPQYFINREVWYEEKTITSFSHSVKFLINIYY